MPQPVQRLRDDEVPKTVSASEAKVKLGSIMDWAVRNRDEVIVQSHGNPKVVIIPFSEYAGYTELREKARRQTALARLEEIARAVQARNEDLSESEAAALADRITRETIESMAAKGKIKFQE